MGGAKAGEYRERERDGWIDSRSTRWKRGKLVDFAHSFPLSLFLSPPSSQRTLASRVIFLHPASVSLALDRFFSHSPSSPPPLIHFGLPRRFELSAFVVLPLLHRSDQLQGKQCLISVNAAIMAIVVVASACRAAWRFEATGGREISEIHTDSACLPLPSQIYRPLCIPVP